MPFNCELSKEIEIILCIANKMKDPASVKQTVLAPENQNPDPLMERSYWSDLSIAGGYTGVLPLYIELDRLFPDQKWDLIAHQYILKIKESIEASGLEDNLSLFGGLGGVCYYLKEASKNGSRYTKIREKLNHALIEKIPRLYFDPLKSYFKQSKSPPPYLYETIQGLSGIGIVCLSHLGDPSFDVLTQNILSLFIQLTYPIQVKDVLVPGWYIEREALFLEEEREQFPHGAFNLGLSHGIPGVLAFLSIAMLLGAEYEGQREAIERIVLWLKRKRNTLSHRFFWDTQLPFEQETSKESESKIKSRDAWCYGTPGVARSLYLAGKALKDQSLSDYALEAFQSIFYSSRKEWDLPGPAMCHGIAGLLLLTHFMQKDSHSTELQERKRELKTILLSSFDQKTPFGFQDLEPMQGGGLWPVNRADLLEGATGIALTLLSLNDDRLLTWHLPFLIDEKYL